jgi:hypothetical protein
LSGFETVGQLSVFFGIAVIALFFGFVGFYRSRKKGK